jgi:hypothetical protein
MTSLFCGNESSARQKAPEEVQGRARRPQVGVILVCAALMTIGVDARGLQGAHPQNAHITFKLDGQGRTAENGAEVSFARYKAEDGTVVERLVKSYRSAENARAALDKLASRTSKVVERGEKKAWDGRRIGIRVRAVMEDEKGSLLTIIAWVDRTRVVELRSSSTRHVLDFEQQDYPASPPKPPRVPVPARPTLEVR